MQRRIDVLAAAYTRDEDQLQVSRRIELPADCFIAMTGNAIRSTRLSPRDRAEMEAWRQSVPHEIHGKSASAAVLDQPRPPHRRLRSLQHVDRDQAHRLTTPDSGRTHLCREGIARGLKLA